MWEIIGSKVDVVNKVNFYINELQKLNSIDEYNDLVSKCFSYKSPDNHKFEKNFFNEILYNNSLQVMLRDESVVNNMKKYDILSYLHFDPKRITLIVLFSRDEELIKSMLHLMYTEFENYDATEVEVVAALTYITQRNVNPNTKKKLVDKISLYDYNLSQYIMKSNV